MNHPVCDTLAVHAACQTGQSHFNPALPTVARDALVRGNQRARPFFLHFWHGGREGPRRAAEEAKITLKRIASGRL